MLRIAAARKLSTGSRQKRGRPGLVRGESPGSGVRQKKRGDCCFFDGYLDKSCGPNRDKVAGLSAHPQFGRRANRTKSRRAKALALYAPIRAASTGTPSRSATRALIPASSSSERLNPTTGRTRLAPEGATGRGGGCRCQLPCPISKNCSQSCLSHIARPFPGEIDLDD
jgi:hypothetical protein